MEELLLAPLWPDPTLAANTSLDNPWAAKIDECIQAPFPLAVLPRAARRE